jgi:tetratricopeptide (TPR) repeat protein
LSSYKGDKLQEKYLEIAKMYFLLKDWQKASSYLNKSSEINPTNAVGLKAQFFLGVLYKAKGDFKEASLVFNKIKTQLPKEWQWFCSYQEADCLYKSGETDKAISLFEALYKEESSSAIPQLAQFNAAYIYLYDFKNIPKAQESLAKLKENKVETTSLYSYIEHKINPDMANEYCRQGFKLIEEGMDSSLTERYKESLDRFDLALKIISKHGTSRIGKALGYYFLNNPEEAISEGLEARRTDPSNDEVLANLGFIYYNLEMLDKAIAQYEEAIKINPNSHIYNYNLATLYALKEKYSKAKSLLRKAIKTNPEYQYAYNNLGYVLWKEGEYSEAKENLKKAIALSPDYVDAHYNLGAVYYTLGNFEEARKEFLQVDKLRPNFRQTWQYLKQINKKIGYD